MRFSGRIARPFGPCALSSCFSVALHFFIPDSLPGAKAITESSFYRSSTSLFCLLAVIGVLFFCWRAFSNNSVYNDNDTGKSDIYSGKNVMVFVPHEDDDINLMGGVFEEYLKYGSTVRVVFATNGDFAGLGEVRMREAISVLDLVGIPEENIFFLGYGDSWANISSIYYAEPDTICLSTNNRTETYGLPSHSAYHDGVIYTRANYVNDIVSILNEFRPDTVFCSDYDFHIDHRTLSLLFDEAIGIIQKQNNDYSPVVFKGFAYETSHYTIDDFYLSNNLRSTQNTCDTEYLTGSNLFQWSRRVRFPVCTSTLSRSLFTSKIYKETKLYDSQYFHQIAGRIVNGDKVFWQRETGSRLYNASFTASSGDPTCLNDFCLLASSDPTRGLSAPFNGFWAPDEEDTRKEVTVDLETPQDLARIVLYDACSLSDNILDAEILFPDGSSVRTGPLNPDGSGTDVVVNRANVSSFTVRILSTEGIAGLSEIEAYLAPRKAPFSMVKLINSSDDFVYDYILSGTSESFSIYTVGVSSEWENYQIQCNNSRCSADVINDQLVVSCPKGQSCVIKITSINDPDLSDSVLFSNPRFFERLGQYEEAFAYNNYSRLQETASYAILRWGYHLFREENIIL